MKKFKKLISPVQAANESGCEVLKESDIYLLVAAYQDEYDRLCNEEYVSKDRYDLEGGFWMQAGCDGIFYLGSTIAEVYETLSKDGVIDQYDHLFGNKPLSPQEVDFLATIQAS